MLVDVIEVDNDEEYLSLRDHRVIVSCCTLISIPVIIVLCTYVPGKNHHHADVAPTNTTHSNSTLDAIELSTGSMMNSEYLLLAAVLMLASVGVGARVKSIVENRWPTLFNSKGSTNIEQHKKGAEEDSSADRFCFNA